MALFLTNGFPRFSTTVKIILMISLSIQYSEYFNNLKPRILTEYFHREK